MDREGSVQVHDEGQRNTDEHSRKTKKCFLITKEQAVSGSYAVGKLK